MSDNESSPVDSDVGLDSSCLHPNSGKPYNDRDLLAINYSTGSCTITRARP